MAWANANQNGTNKSSTSGNTLTIINSGSLAAESTYFVIIASDNTTSGDSETSLVSSISDGTNTYTKVVEFTNGQTAVAGGATVSVWKTDIGTTQAPKTVTINFASNVTAKAAEMWGFTHTSGNISSATTFVTNATDGADPAAQTISSLASNEYLWLHAIAHEGPNTDTITSSTNYTGATGTYSAVGAGTSGGGGGGNMSVAMEYRINTATGDTVNFVSTAADAAQVFIALREKSIGNRDITAVSGAIRYTGQTPTVERTANQSITAVSGAIRYTGQTPTAFADNPVSIAAASGAVIYTGQTPTVAVTNNTFVDAVSGAILYAGTTPTVARTENQAISAVSGAIRYTGQTPSVSTAAGVDVDAVSGAIVYTGQTPTVARTENQDIAALSGAIVYTGQTPSVATDDSIAIPAVSGSIIYAGQVPLVEVSVDQLPVEAPTVVAGRPARRMRRRLLCRINGEIVEIDDVNHLFKLLKECRKDIKELAYEKAQEIVRTGRRVSEVREQEPRAVEVIDAPRAAMEAIEDRIREMEAFYWMRVSAGVKQIQRDDEEALFLMGQL